MTEYLRWLFTPVDSFYVASGLASAQQLAQSSSLLFWLVMLVIFRYELPIMCIYVAYLFNRRAFEPQPLKTYAGREPLVTFLIAGRNAGRGIVTCITSVLEGEYQNVEVIFVDDRSSDDSVARARAFEATGRVRVVANPNHSGKPANLNLGLMLARGEFIFVLDADSRIYPDAVRNMLPYFEDPQVGGVSPSILVNNASASFLTRFQQIEYVITYTLNQLWRDSLGMIMILSGMGTMFRASAMRSLGGYDMGLGDDTDITIRLRKTKWKLRTSLRGRIATNVPVNLRQLMRQRSRWTRNMVKVRLRKHRDLGTFRYGFVNGFCFYEQVINRVLHPFLIVGLVLYVHFYEGVESAFFVGGFFWFTCVLMLMKFFIGRDMTRGEPSMRALWLVPFYVFYRIPLLLVQVFQISREALRIKLWHPYVPKRIWDQIPFH